MFSVLIRRRGRTGKNRFRKDVTQSLIGVEMESPEPEALAAHWGQIIGILPGTNTNGEPTLTLPNCTFNFVKGFRDIISGLTFRVGDVAKVGDAARAKGHTVAGDTFFLGGVTFALVA
jgi:hypothetical protein